MASKVEIANRALQLLGAKRITSLTEDSRNARAINAAFEPVKLAELRKHQWSFAIKRAQIAEDTTTPLFTKAASYTLPADFIALANKDPEDNFNTDDWQIEGRSIVTNDDGPLEIRYVADVTDVNQMDPLFREVLASKLAEQLCEEITQSNTKIQTAMQVYEQNITAAKKANAIERVSQEPPEDVWLTCRY